MGISLSVRGIRFNQLWMIGNGNLDQTVLCDWGHKSKESGSSSTSSIRLILQRSPNAWHSIKKANDITIGTHSNGIGEGTCHSDKWRTVLLRPLPFPYHSGWAIRRWQEAKLKKKALGFFMGVSLTEHEIVWSYTPTGLYLGMFISISSLLSLIFLWKKHKKWIDDR